ncbi:MAG TPA: DUF2330 domain-containing protein [Fimbriimonas sp.]
MARRILLLVLTALASLALGDGMVFPAGKAGLTEKPPSIPDQRAVLKWDGEIETMIVESTLAGPRGTYGWVVPLPTRPSYVKAVKPEYIAGTFAQVRPPVKPLKERDLTLPAAAALFLSVMLLTSAMRYRKQEVGTRLLLFFGEALAGALVLGWVNASPAAQDLATAGIVERAASAAGSAKKSVEVESLGTIGSYDVSVLYGEEGKPLMEWLKEHDIRVPENAQKVVDAYAKEGWCFLAAEFRKDEDRPLPPHPLKAVFPSKELVYPMRLTGTQDQPLRLEIVVVADRLAQIEGLEAWSCDTRDLLVNVPRDAALDARIYEEWKGSLYAMAKDGAVATYLRGDVPPSRMKKDYRVAWKPIERFQVEVHDRKQAVGHAIGLAFGWMPVAAAFFGLLGVVFLGHMRALLALGAILTVAVSGAVGEGWLNSVKTVEAEESR